MSIVSSHFTFSKFQQILSIHNPNKKFDIFSLSFRRRVSPSQLMEKSSASNQPQRPSVRLRERLAPPTPYPEIMTPPSTQTMLAPTSSTSQPPETSDGRIYLRILREVAESIKPTGRLSEVFTQLAAQLREEEAPPSSRPLEATTESVEPVPALIAPLPTQVAPKPIVPLGRSISAEHDQVRDKGTEFKEAVEYGETERSGNKGGIEGEVQGLAGGVSERQTLREVIVVEERSSDDRETLDKRAKRRNLRAARKDEMVEVEGKLVETAAKAVENFQMEERKRKEKQDAIPSAKRRLDQALKGITIREPIEDLTLSPRSQAGKEGSKDVETSDDEGVYERLEVKIDQILLKAMVYFKDPKLRRDCARRRQKGKKVKSGKKLHRPSLRGMDCEEQFLTYIKAIGFEWLLEHSSAEVPVNLAHEFFTSFHFNQTTDLDTESIRFRVFNQEMVMTLREWTLSLGLLSQEEDESGKWSGREIGQPEDTEGFEVQAAWRLMTTEDAPKFKTSESKGTDIINPVLRLAQVFLAHNLLGQVNGVITTPELYFMWCMLAEVKVHLGYWIALAIHKIARHPVRHLFNCHLLGAYLQRNVKITIARPQPIFAICEASDLFDIGFFLNTGLATRDKSGTLQFYEVGQTGETLMETEQEAEAEETPTKVETRAEKNPTPTKEMPTGMDQEWRKMVENKLLKIEEATTERLSASLETQQSTMEHLLQKVKKIHEDQRKLSELQSEDMNKAFTLVEKMTELAEMNSRIAQHLLSVSIPKESQKKTSPVRTPIKKRDATASTSQTTAAGSEGPARRVKLARTKRSGSPGGQSKN